MKRLEQHAQPIKALSILHVQSVNRILTTVFKFIYSGKRMPLMNTHMQTYIYSVNKCEVDLRMYTNKGNQSLCIQVT